MKFIDRPLSRSRWIYNNVIEIGQRNDVVYANGSDTLCFKRNIYERPTRIYRLKKFNAVLPHLENFVSPSLESQRKWLNKNFPNAGIAPELFSDLATDTFMPSTDSFLVSKSPQDDIYMCINIDVSLVCIYSSNSSAVLKVDVQNSIRKVVSTHESSSKLIVAVSTDYSLHMLYIAKNSSSFNLIHHRAFVFKKSTAMLCDNPDRITFKLNESYSCITALDFNVIHELIILSEGMHIFVWRESSPDEMQLLHTLPCSYVDVKASHHPRQVYLYKHSSIEFLDLRDAQIYSMEFHQDIADLKLINIRHQSVVATRTQIHLLDRRQFPRSLLSVENDYEILQKSLFFVYEDDILSLFYLSTKLSAIYLMQLDISYKNPDIPPTLLSGPRIIYTLDSMVSIEKGMGIQEKNGISYYVKSKDGRIDVFSSLDKSLKTAKHFRKSESLEELHQNPFLKVVDTHPLKSSVVHIFARNYKYLSWVHKNGQMENILLSLAKEVVLCFKDKNIEISSVFELLKEHCENSQKKDNNKTKSSFIRYENAVAFDNISRLFLEFGQMIFFWKAIEEYAKQEGMAMSLLLDDTPVDIFMLYILLSNAVLFKATKKIDWPRTSGIFTTLKRSFDDYYVHAPSLPTSNAGRARIMTEKQKRTIISQESSQQTFMSSNDIIAATQPTVNARNQNVIRSRVVPENMSSSQPSTLRGKKPRKSGF